MQAATFPVIYTALEFYRAESGKRTFHTHHVAACSVDDAIGLLHECNHIDFSQVFIVTDAVHERDRRAAVQTRINQFRTDEIDHAEFVRWVDVMTHETWSDGERYPAAWQRVPEPLKAAA